VGADNLSQPLTWCLIFTTEVRGLSIALARTPFALALDMHWLNGKARQAELSFPDEVSALLLRRGERFGTEESCDTAPGQKHRRG